MTRTIKSQATARADDLDVRGFPYCLVRTGDNTWVLSEDGPTRSTEVATIDPLDLARLLSLMNTVARGNTDANDLADMASDLAAHLRYYPTPVRA